MKISKLFHWLYALVMLLPIFAIGVTCGYAMFNKNAYQSYTGKIEYKETLNVTSSNQYINDVVYFTKEQVRLPYNGQIYNLTILQVEEEFNSIDYEYNYYSLKGTDSTHCAIYGHQIKKDGENTIQTTELKRILWSYSAQRRMVDKLSFEDLYYDSDPSYLLIFFNQFYYNDYYVDNNVSNVFYYSIDKVKESPMFSWAYNSFLVTPFSYIVNLFSMPTNSIVVLLLSYWLTISICWLVFDLVMFVPLLVHRWIDKGVIE